MNLLLCFVCIFITQSHIFCEKSGEKSFEFYENSNVTVLFSSNFDELVLQSDRFWIVQFYAPWCYYSKEIVPEYKALATHMKPRDICVGAMEAHGHDPFYSQLKLRGFPTIKMYGANKSQPIYYKGRRTADDIIRFVNDFNESGNDLPKAECLIGSLEWNNKLFGLNSGNANGKSACILFTTFSFTVTMVWIHLAFK